MVLDAQFRTHKQRLRTRERGLPLHAYWEEADGQPSLLVRHLIEASCSAVRKSLSILSWYMVHCGQVEGHLQTAEGRQIPNWRLYGWYGHIAVFLECSAVSKRQGPIYSELCLTSGVRLIQRNHFNPLSCFRSQLCWASMHSSWRCLQRTKRQLSINCFHVKPQGSPTQVLSQHELGYHLPAGAWVERHGGSVQAWINVSEEAIQRHAGGVGSKLGRHVLFPVKKGDSSSLLKLLPERRASPAQVEQGASNGVTEWRTLHMAGTPSGPVSRQVLTPPLYPLVLKKKSCRSWLHLDFPGSPPSSSLCGCDEVLGKPFEPKFTSVSRSIAHGKFLASSC